MNIDSVQNGIVLDHIKAGRSLDIYYHLGLDKLDCEVAIIKNARSNKMGRKDIIKIAGDLETAKSSRESALALQAEYEEKLRSIDKEAEAILDEARKKAKKQEAEILEEARAEAGRILERASREIDLEKKKALEDVKTEIVSIASLMAGKAVAASMDVKIQDSLIQETLKEMGESTWQS